MEVGAFVKELFESSNATQKVFSKGDYLLTHGKVENHIYLIVSGAVRAIAYINEEEQTIRLGYKGSIMTSVTSFYTSQPSEFSIEAIRKTVVKIIPKHVFLEFVQKNTHHLEVYNKLLTELVLSQMEREIDLLTVAPHERLMRVLTRSPQLFQEVPMKYIASYLRMKPETLSRIRNS